MGKKKMMQDQSRNRSQNTSRNSENTIKTDSPQDKTDKPKWNLWDPDQNIWLRCAVYFVVFIATTLIYTITAAKWWGESFWDTWHQWWYLVIFAAVVVMVIVGWDQKELNIKTASKLCGLIIAPLVIYAVFDSVWATWMQIEKSKPQNRQVAWAGEAATDHLSIKALATISKIKYDNRAKQNLLVPVQKKEVGYKIYQPGEYTFSLKAGEKTDHWITFPVGEYNYSLTSEDDQFKLLYDDGEIAPAWEPGEWPHKTNFSFRVMASDVDQLVEMIVEKI